MAAQRVSLERLLTGTAAWFLRACRDGQGRRVVLRLAEDGELRLQVDGDALSGPPGELRSAEDVLRHAAAPGADERLAWPAILAACREWRLTVEAAGRRREVSGRGGAWRGFLADTGAADTTCTRLAFRPDPELVPGDFQSPEVLLALREQAARWPEGRFEVALPSTVRDVQRARAALDSRPRSVGDGSRLDARGGR